MSYLGDPTLVIIDWSPEGKGQLTTIPVTLFITPNQGTQGKTITVTATGIFYDSHTTFNFGTGLTISSTTIINSSTAKLTLIISATAALGLRNLTTTGTTGSSNLANAFNIFASFVLNTGDFYDYIFKFPDQGSFARDPTILQFGVPGVPLLVYNPVETVQLPIPTIGNTLVFPPQLAQSTVPLPGFWVMVTIQSQPFIQQLQLHPNLQILNDRTRMFARQPSVVQSLVDVTHINIIINSFGVYVRDGLTSIPLLLLEDNVSQLLLETGVPLELESLPAKPSPSSYVGPGDVLGANLFTAFWGFRAFSAATTGNNAVRLRRNSDSVTMDFRTLSDGTLDAASITAFRGTSNLTVAIMYDQTGNGHDLSPTNSTFEQAFTQNVLNGMGVYNNLVPNPTAYRTGTTFTILNTYSNCFYNVFKSIAQQLGNPFSFQNCCASGDDEIGLVADRDVAFNSMTLKNEGGNADGGLPNNNVPESTWHVAVGVVNQNVGSISFLNIDNLSIPASASGPLVGNPNNLFATICMWGEDGGGPNTNVLQGYGAEGAWFATPTPNAPWTQAQSRALIANAKAFWGI